METPWDLIPARLNLNKQYGRIMHKVFISYHHYNDQEYKEYLLQMNKWNNIFLNHSVDTGNIDDDLPAQTIRLLIRDHYLRDSTVTILLVGTETKYRKHIDWELYSSMIDGSVNKRSGILVINLPTINCSHFRATHAGEKERLYSGDTSWTTITDRAEYERRYPYMPARIIDNLLKNEAKISVVNWDKIKNNPDNLAFLIDVTCNDRTKCQYDLSRPMRKADYNP